MNTIALEYRTNKQITTSRCRLIDENGEQLGVFDTKDALRRADDLGYDLVEIAPEAQPPVCRIMDFSKYKYEQSVKEKQARKKQQRVEIKEMKFRPKVDTHDYETKKRHILRFLDAGAKVKVTIMFRGRETSHPEQGLNILMKLAEELQELAVIENQPKLEGRNMHMLIAPLPKPKAAKTEKGEDAHAEDQDA